LFTQVCEQIAAAGLNQPHVRIVLEKPLGHDLASNRAINDAVRKAFTERQVFRIDHYLGKPSVQNLFALRFGNALFEPLWRRETIANIQITIAEDLGVEKRGAFYDQTGALRDMVQNHALQLLCAIGMEPPINATPTPSATKNSRCCARSSPGRPRRWRSTWCAASTPAGNVNGQPVRAYRDEPGVAPPATPKPLWRCAPKSPTGAGPACPFTSAPANGWPGATHTSW
jgi:glucose-6-phosphate 1-dehydrogenase